MKKKCELCLKNPAIENSHIIPKFVFKWMKNSGTGYLREISEINLRTQDGPKINLLCKHCENKFGKYEKYFSENIFKPVLENEIDEFVINIRIEYFIISVFWRIFKIRNEDIQNTAWEKGILELVESWRIALNNMNLDKLNHEIHLLTGVDITTEEYYEGLIEYMSRAVDSGIPNNENVCFWYFKIPRFLFFIPIGGIKNKNLEHTIVKRNSVYKMNMAHVKCNYIGKYIIQRVNQIKTSKETDLTHKQKEKISQTTDNKIELIANKDLGQINKFISKKRKANTG